MGVILLLIGLRAPAAPGTGKKVDRFREIRLRVIDLDGAPARGRDVELRGLSRGALFGEPPWSYTTDKAGRVTVQLYQLHTWEDEKQRPGWGNYALVITPKEGRDAGAVSPIFMNVGKMGDSTYGGDRIAGRWGVPIYVPDDGVDLAVQITRGIVVEGTVWDYEDREKPLAGVSVTLCHDLGSETHTGYGGEIFWQKATTDEKGKYRFEHVYPQQFILQPAGATLDVDSYWLRTRIDENPWKEEPIYGLMPSGSGVTQIDLGVATRKLFRYFGKVTDRLGEPVKGAKVTFGVSLHKEPETHLDHHHFVNAISGADGSYEILLPTPWVNGMSAAMGEQTRDDRWEGGYAPGEYNFEFPR